MFRNRKDAGLKLAEKLDRFCDQKNTIVVALPRGGVPVGFEIAKKLHLPLDIVCPRKIGAPMNPEFAIGAITETGEGIFDTTVIERLNIPKQTIDQIIQTEMQEALNRLQKYRSSLKKRCFLGKTILLVDDGLATGSTMKAAILSLKKQKVDKIIVAVPVSPKDTKEEIANQVDEIIVLNTPLFFQAVGQFYENFSQTEDDEVIECLRLCDN